MRERRVVVDVDTMYAYLILYSIANAWLSTTALHWLYLHNTPSTASVVRFASAGRALLKAEALRSIPEVYSLDLYAPNVG